MKPTICLVAFVAIFLAMSFAPSCAAGETQSIVLAGGCFWGMESVFDHTKGVTDATVGFAGGSADTAHYETVSTGSTGHAESVRVTFDPQKITLSQLLDIYFKVAHDPTELDYQGPDHGTQYRSTVFYATPEQQKAVADKIAALNAENAFESPIVTTQEPLKGFYRAEDYHQHYAEEHPLNPYILINDAPKVTKLRSTYPQLYKE
jgi:peptide-methionine (S)-S-oxide reductase